MALAIAAVLIGAAVPSMSGLLQRNQARIAADALTRALHATRLLAIERDRHALFCASDDGRRCSGSHAWQHGWLIALDQDGDGQPDGTPLRVQPALHGLRIVGSRHRTRIRFHADGSAPGSNLTLRICPDKGSATSVTAIVVSNAGRIRVQRSPATRCKV
ncbi:hypothetical protein LF63_0104315 [Oleiagrimonas soli]|uniref:Type II secretion system protein H n=1 Tax=Oleiagrimonas soli TaxID=1543381 RepID=A0A099CYQ6_9GAMM|nr:hypothetical protein LF63_0104315 [Oleiagrimonas soli]